MSRPNTPIPEVLRSETVHNGYFEVRIDHLQLPHGPKLHYTVLNLRVDAAAIIARTPDGKLVINQEYRHPTKHWLLSCPGGRIDTGESPSVAAVRELIEETGYAGDPPISLGSVYPFPAVTDQRIHYLLIDNAIYQGPPALEPFELIHTTLKTEQEILNEIASGTLVDGVLCTGLYLLRSKC